MSPGTEWILLLSQLPSSPSSIRVMVWRRMRAAGAISMHNGAWVLPDSPKNVQFMQEILSYVNTHGGTASIFISRALNPEAEAGLIDAFTLSTDQDYAEFMGECSAFQAEVDMEIAQKELTFADLDENEAELQKLTSWLRKIRSRDNFGNPKAHEASNALESCRRKVQAFARHVYRNEGIDVAENEISYTDE